MSGKWIFLCATFVGQAHSFTNECPNIAPKETWAQCGIAVPSAGSRRCDPENTFAPDSSTHAISIDDSVHASSAQSTTQQPSLTTVIQRLRPRLDAGYHTAPLHPYFRNEGRIVSDLRRLVYFVDKKSLSGYESVPELVAIARKLPEAKQTAIIRAAVAGSIANFGSEIVTKHLRRQKLSAVEIEAERVRLQASLRGAHLQISRSLETQALVLRFPALRVGYTHTVYPKLLSHSFDLSPLPRLALNYTRWGELDIFNGRYYAFGGFALISHDYTNKITLFGWQIEQNKNRVGVYFMKQERIPKADWLRLDFWLQW